MPFIIAFFICLFILDVMFNHGVITIKLLKLMGILLLLFVIYIAFVTLKSMGTAWIVTAIFGVLIMVTVGRMVLLAVNRR